MSPEKGEEGKAGAGQDSGGGNPVDATEGLASEMCQAGRAASSSQGQAFAGLLGEEMLFHQGDEDDGLWARSHLAISRQGVT